jgi:hypothetical protein
VDYPVFQVFGFRPQAPVFSEEIWVKPVLVPNAHIPVKPRWCSLVVVVKNPTWAPLDPSDQWFQVFALIAKARGGIGMAGA